MRGLFWPRAGPKRLAVGSYSGVSSDSALGQNFSANCWGAVSTFRWLGGGISRIGPKRLAVGYDSGVSSNSALGQDFSANRWGGGVYISMVGWRTSGRSVSSDCEPFGVGTRFRGVGGTVSSGVSSDSALGQNFSANRWGGVYISMVGWRYLEDWPEETCSRLRQRRLFGLSPRPRFLRESLGWGVYISMVGWRTSGRSVSSDCEPFGVGGRDFGVWAEPCPASLRTQPSAKISPRIVGWGCLHFDGWVAVSRGLARRDAAVGYTKKRTPVARSNEVDAEATTGRD